MKNENNDSESDTYNEEEMEGPIETLIHGFIESQHIHDCKTRLLNLP
jgi:hypothetical protein